MIDQTFSPETTPRVEVSIQSGDIRLLPAEDGRVRVVADAHKDAGLEVRQRGGTVVVTTDKRSWFRSDNADVTIYAPMTTEAVINTASADVNARTPLSKLEVNTASGDVEFVSVVDLQVRTASGDVKGDQVIEGAHVVGASGDVKIKTCSGKNNFSSASGDLAIDRCEGGSLTASTASGDVSINFCQSSEISFKSMSGSVSIGLPPKTRVNLDVNTLSGKVNIPESSNTGEEPESTMSLKVRLVSGDVNLFRSA